MWPNALKRPKLDFLLRIIRNTNMKFGMAFIFKTNMLAQNSY